MLDFALPDRRLAVKELAARAVETARSRLASYADARAVRLRTQSLVVKNGKVGSIGETESLGVGIRVIADGSWGFAATPDLSSAAIDRAAAEAVAVARASARVQVRAVHLAPNPPVRDEWRTAAEALEGWIATVK